MDKTCELLSSLVFVTSCFGLQPITKDTTYQLGDIVITNSERGGKYEGYIGHMEILVMADGKPTWVGYEKQNYDTPYGVRKSEVYTNPVLYRK